ncbi:MAG: DUF1629 domain-containing protein [Cyanobacteria bacterium J06581_3]
MEKGIKIWEQASYLEVSRKESQEAISSTMLTLRQPLEDFSEKVTYVVSDAREPEDFFECGVARIVSEKIVQIVSSFSPLKAQFFPVKVIHNGEDAGRYFYMNVFHEINCFDFDLSKYSCDEEIDFIESIYQLVLRPVNSEHHLFFVAKVDFSILCASDVLSSKLNNAGCTGIRFTDPSQAFF